MAPKDKDTTPASIPEEHDGETHELDDHEQEAAIAVPDSGDSGEGGKLKMIVQLPKKCLGVKDLAAMYVFDVLLPYLYLSFLARDF